MHWLEQQVAALQQRLAAHEREKAQRVEAVPASQITMSAVADGGAGDISRTIERIDQAQRSANHARGALRDGLIDLGNAVCQRPGITACAVAHEGLVLSYAGPPDLAEVLAVAAQKCHDSAAMTSRTVRLGAPRQMVVLGEQGKLALLFFGPLVVAILAPPQTALSAVLAR